MAYNWDASIYVVSAILGNWYAESGLNPNVFEGHVAYTNSQLLSTSISGGYGLGQWTTTSSGSVNRRIPLLNWLSNNGYNYYDGEGQCKYLVAEGSWSQNYGDYSSLDDFLCSDSEDVSELTECYLKCWEIPADQSDSVVSTRVSYAYTAFDILVEYYESDVEYTWYCSNDTSGYVTDNDQLISNRCAAFAILGDGRTDVGTIGGGSGTEDETSESWNFIYYLGRSPQKKKFIRDRNSRKGSIRNGSFTR